MRVDLLPPTEQSAVDVGMFLFETFAREHNFAGIEHGRVNAERAYAYIWDALTNGAVWLVRDEDGIAGSISLTPRQLWWTDTDYWGDGWFYVRPDKRTTKAAFMLLGAAEDFCRQTGKPLSICVWNAEEVDRKDRFLRRMGFIGLGGFYVKETS